MGAPVQNFSLAAQISASDSSDINTQLGKGSGKISYALYIGTTGDVVVVTENGSTCLFKNHPVGYMPGEIRQVMATGTTASDFVALWNE